MLERSIEKTLKHATEKAGGLCIKTDPTHMAGIPDRIVILPGGHAAFIELKQAGKKPRPIQAYRLDQLTRLGMPTYILDNTRDIPQVLDEIQSTPLPTASN